MTPANSRQFTAYHEAGHAVLALVLDLGPGDVTIKSNGIYAGVSLDEGDCPIDEDAVALYERAPEAFRMRHAACYYAGAHAARRAGQRDWKDGASQDYDAAWHVLDDITSDEDTVKALAKLCERRAELLVGHYWCEIKAVATQLVDHETIVGDTLRKIVKDSLRNRKAIIRAW